jgi:hypothetical protein
MPENDPLPSHAEFVDRLRKAQKTAPATIGDHDPLLDQIASRYDHLADTMDDDAHILGALRAQLRTAINRGISPSDLYDTLTHVGLALSHHQFTRILAKQRAKPGESNEAAMTADEWIRVLAPALRGAPTTADYETISAPLRTWGVDLSAAALQQAHLDLLGRGGHDSTPPWARVLDQMDSHLIAMARIGCAAADIAACLARRHLRVPENDIEEWLERTLQKPRHVHARHATQNARDLLAKEERLTRHRFSVTVDPVLADPYRVTVICPNKESASFARKWIAAGTRALNAQIPTQATSAAKTPRRSRQAEPQQEPTHMQ